jgi:ABC-type uncharacterized transport system auxiliary subunit
MHRLTHLVPIALLALYQCGCGAPRPIRFYTIQIPLTPARTNTTVPVDLLVARITAPSLLQAEPIVYRIGVNEIGTYQYHRWADPPVAMVQANLIRLLRSSGDYQSVESAGSPNADEFVVRGRLADFTEVDGPTINGLVTMEFELYDRKTAKVLWSHFYSQTEPAQSKEISQVVQALDRNLDRGLKEVVASLSHYFAANPPRKT